jgi:hypothetical protein
MNVELTQIGLYLLFLGAGWVIRHKGILVPQPQMPQLPGNHPVLDEIKAMLTQLMDQQQKKS